MVSAPDRCPKVPGSNPGSSKPALTAIFRRFAEEMMLGCRLSSGVDRGRKTKRTCGPPKKEFRHVEMFGLFLSVFELELFVFLYFY